MLFCESEIREREDSFYKNIIRLYLKYGSVDEVFKKTKYELPISYPGMHHLIKRWGIVKSVGPNSKLSESLTFLKLLTENKIPLERLYKKMPPSFKTSLSTMHRIAHNVKEGIVRRYGTALVVSVDSSTNILVGHDLSHKKVTLPMTYSSPKEDRSISILRVLQQEVFSQLAIEKFDLTKVIPKDIQPFMYLTIADIKVVVYPIELDIDFIKKHGFSSEKVADHRLVPVANIQNSKLSIRPGVLDIVKGYKKYIRQEVSLSDQVSELNLALAQVCP